MCKMLIPALLGAVVLWTAPANARERLTPEQELAKLIKDRVPGKPVDCIQLTEIRSTTIIDKTAIVYDAGNVLYVNRPAFPESLGSDDVLLTKTWSNQLCRLDMVQLLDRSMNGFMRGMVGLNEFVPYARPPKPAPAPAAPPAQ
ncbi:hypothetical protein GTZ99_11090 [Novosphingobium sp. FSY-8]|uniref:Uncharacterized protein n=2 Tax=Novosphingobium ovatum TaxID=1908523 RepID=A0ABW9XEZ1_9SPHN|nr:hypothetical protein [Novosphingobium ovatum]